MENKNSNIKKRIKTKLPPFLSQEEIKKLLGSISLSVTGIRNRAIVSTMSYAGLRVSEVVNLKVKDVNIKESWIHVKDGKTGDRDVPITSDLVSYLIIWEKVKPIHAKFYFVNVKGESKGKKVSRKNIEKFIRLLGKKVLSKRVYPHMLRHSFATHMLKRNNINSFDLQYLLGHKSISSTQIYTHIEPEALKKKILEEKKEVSEKVVSEESVNIKLIEIVKKQQEELIKMKETIKDLQEKLNKLN